MCFSFLSSLRFFLFCLCQTQLDHNSGFLFELPFESVEIIQNYHRSPQLIVQQERWKWTNKIIFKYPAILILTMTLHQSIHEIFGLDLHEDIAKERLEYLFLEHGTSTKPRIKLYEYLFHRHSQIFSMNVKYLLKRVFLGITWRNGTRSGIQIIDCDLRWGVSQLILKLINKDYSFYHLNQ